MKPGRQRLLTKTFDVKQTDVEELAALNQGIQEEHVAPA